MRMSEREAREAARRAGRGQVIVTAGQANPLQQQLRAPNQGECAFLSLWKALSTNLIVEACGLSKEGRVLAQGFAITPVAVGLDQPTFGPRNNWHFDFAFLCAKVGIEIDGGRKGNNPHQVHNDHFERDRERDNWAQEYGWVVLRYTMEMLDSPDRVIGQVVRVVRGRL